VPGDQKGRWWWRSQGGREKNELEERAENPAGCRGGGEYGLSTSFLQTRIFCMHGF